MKNEYQDFFAEIPPELQELFKSIEHPWEILNGGLKKYFAGFTENQILGEVSDQAILEGDGIIICKNAKVEGGAYIKGPCFIGEGTEVRHGAYLRGNVFAARNCVLGHSTEVKHAIFFDEAKAGHFNYIGDSILGNKVNLGAGTKLANLKIIPGNIFLKIDGENVDSGLRKFGAILGDSCETGCNSVLNPGTVLGPRSMVFPNVSAHGVHLQRSKHTGR